MHLLKEKHYQALNAAKDHGTTETIEELDKLRKTLEDKIGDFMEIGEEQDMLMGKHEAVQHSFGENRVKVEKGSKIIQVL